MDIVCSESDLVRSLYPTDIVRQLEYRVITASLGCRLISGGECSGDGDYKYLRQPGRVIKILHTEIAQGKEIL